jgi:hypothetical protein
MAGKRDMVVIGLVGAKGCGKSTVANLLVETYGFQRLRLADPLKEMLKTLGLTEAQVDGDQKEASLAFLCGKTPRHAMQTLGTEWGRNLIGGDLWVNACQQRIMRLATGRKRRMIVVDDVRFPNEVRMIREMGGLIWSVRRPDAEPKEPSRIELKLYDWGLLKGSHLHPSERHWRRIEVDAAIRNVRCLRHLGFEVEVCARKHGFAENVAA